MAFAIAKKAGKDPNVTCPKRTAYQLIAEAMDGVMKDHVAAARVGKGKAA